jgi:hypothetical protein
MSFYKIFCYSILMKNLFSSPFKSLWKIGHCQIKKKIKLTRIIEGRENPMIYCKSSPDGLLMVGKKNPLENKDKYHALNRFIIQKWF